MNRRGNVIRQLGYDGVLLTMPEVAQCYPDYRELAMLGADACYFTAGHPAILFSSTTTFDADCNKKIARILHAAWNYRKVLLLIAYSNFEVRVYNCYAKPGYISKTGNYEKELEVAHIQSASLRDGNLDEFAAYFSREAIDVGALWESQSLRIDVSRRVDAYLVDCLDRTKEALLKTGLGEKYIHALLIRSLFVLFLEDKGATKAAGVYTSINPDYNSYFDILKDKSSTYRLFKLLNARFDGDVTRILSGEEEKVTSRQLELVRRCFIDGDLSDNPKLFNDWRLFRFEIIRIELLSEIYEHFLGASKTSKGQYYTPPNLVDLILSEKIPDDTRQWDMKILDPACGSGIFLVESYKRLIRIWKLVNKKDKIDFESLKAILCNNIYGIDIDATALSVASLGLYLTLINELDPRTLWMEPDYKLPRLIHKEGREDDIVGNLWCQDTIATDFKSMLPEMDLVVGNPPYGTRHRQKSITDYCRRFGFADEMALPFIHKVATLCPNGEIALVVNMKVLTNATGTYGHFRDWLLREAYVEKIYNLSIFRNAPKEFGGSLFSSAKTPVAVLHYRASRLGRLSKHITYWAPRTYVKSNLLYDIVLDSCDLKCLPRKLCESNETWVWKIGAWGNAMSHRVVAKMRRLPTLQSTFDKNNWVYGRGCNADSKNAKVAPEFLLDLNRIKRYCVPNDAVVYNNKNKVFRENKQDIFNPPYVVMKECPDKEGVIAGIFHGDAVTTTSAFVFNGMTDDDKKVLAAYLNSRVGNAYLFLTSSTWGIERERLLLNEEVMQMPSPYVTITNGQRNRIVTLYNQICKNRSALMHIDTTNEERCIDKLFYSILGLSDFEAEVMEDVYDNSLSLFALKDKAKAMRKVTKTELCAYAQRLCQSINDYYRKSKTRVSPEVFLPNEAMPLCMTIVRFGVKKRGLRILDGKRDRDRLRKMYRVLTAKLHSGITIQRVLRQYKGDSIILIKPNQRRYWTTMQAVEDGGSIFAEILAMKEG